MEDKKCKRDGKDVWVYSHFCNRYICLQCVEDGMYIDKIAKEISNEENLKFLKQQESHKG